MKEKITNEWVINPEWVELIEKENAELRKEIREWNVKSGLIQWLENGKYRVIMHRHDGSFRAVDEAYNTSWETDTLEGLLSALNDPKNQPIERAP